MDLTGKNVVYVGGFGGIGLSVCKRLMGKKISNLAILDVVEKPEELCELKELNPSVNVFYLKLDLCDKENIKDCLQSIIERTQFIDVLINGSGVVNEQNVELTVTVNLIGLINATLLAIPLMDKSLKGRGGLIMNVSSSCGLEPSPSSAVYSATMHGVIGFTRSLAHEYYKERTGISMMAFCPGLTLTPFLVQYEESGLTFPYSEHVRPRILVRNGQTADECGQNLVQAIETGQNGSVWLSDRGNLQQVMGHQAGNECGQRSAG